MGAAKAAADTAVRLGAAGSWSFDKEEIEAVIADWKELLEQLKEDRVEFSMLSTTSAHPSEDQPSSAFVKSLYDGIAALEESNFSMEKYVSEFIEKLEEAKSSIGQSDSDGASAFGSGNMGEV